MFNYGFDYYVEHTTAPIYYEKKNMNSVNYLYFLSSQRKILIPPKKKPVIIRRIKKKLH